MGFERIRELALNIKVCELFSSEKCIQKYSRISLWEHSIAVAMLAKMIYRREFRDPGDLIYIAGLLHEIGIIAVDQFLHDHFHQILNQTFTGGLNLPEVESQTLGYNHADLGQALTNSWDLPQEVIASIGFHHNPLNGPRKYLKPILTLYIADYLCQKKEFGFCDTPFAGDRLYLKCLDKLNLKPRALDLIVKEMEEEFLKLKEHQVFRP